MGDEGAEEILKKLDESSTKQNLKTVTGGVLIDMENTDNYGNHCYRYMYLGFLLAHESVAPTVPSVDRMIEEFCARVCFSGSRN